MKEKRILEKSKESTVRKHEYKQAQLAKKIDKLEKIVKEKDIQIIEKDKEIRLHQVKLREFLQRNMKDLPLRTFDEIEDIIDYDPN